MWTQKTVSLFVLLPFLTFPHISSQTRIRPVCFWHSIGTNLSSCIKCLNVWGPIVVTEQRIHDSEGIDYGGAQIDGRVGHAQE